MARCTACSVAPRDPLEVEHAPDTWSRSRRVVVRAEHSAHGDNPRFVATPLDWGQIAARDLYAGLYCARGDMEKRIQEQQLGLFAERISAETLHANQVRLYCASIGYTRMHALRRLTLRVRLLKSGARVTTSVRRIVVSLSQAFPLQDAFRRVLGKLREPCRAPI